ncbi:uncharacterized protein PAE49_017852 isoform 1-T1 [Odontesthes bonariensis]|uniref:uncharacterized protein LOC142401779 n=1 Tax=Odontesthes bonariensis TaxID=219752 RepID=UPI003F582B4C
MGNSGSVTNSTPYDWIFDRGRQFGEDVCTLYRNSSREYSEDFGSRYKLYFRYEGHSDWDLWSWGDGHSLTLRESSNRERFELVCNDCSGRVVDSCPHFGRIEEEKQEQKRRQQEEQRRREEEQKRRQQEEQRRREEEQKRRQQEEQRRREEEQKRRQQEEQRRREEEEKRRQAELERMRRIQEQIEQQRREQERLEQERLEQERLERQRLKRQRLIRERLERQRLEQERLEQERLEQERLEQKRLEQERLEQERLERQRLKQQRLIRERLERLRLEQERLEQERLEQKRLEQERLEQERLEQERLEQKRLEQERLEQERLEQERLEQERLEQERLEQKRLEQERQRRRIQEQIEEENEASRRTLSQAKERLQEQQHLKARGRHLQHSQVLHQIVEDHAAHIERDELGEVEQEFEELLTKYQITENENVKTDLEDRMKTLQNELISNHFRENEIPICPLWALDQATGYVELPLTERFSVLEAVVKVTLEGNSEFEAGQDKKIEFLLSLQDQLHVTNPTLARKVLINVLDMTSPLPKAGKEILSQILFNNIWTRKEIKLFMGRARSIDQEQVTQILHKVCTYRLSCLLALSALNDKDPVAYIQGCVSSEADKDGDTILSEMLDKNYPEHILSQLEDILRYVEDELPKQRRVNITAKMIEEWKRMIVSLDFAKPNTDTLKKVLVVLSIAVKKCTTFTTARGEKVQGYFPRLTQLASLLLLLLPQFQDKKGCLLEIGTGEGKTCILAMFATIQATRGAAVDIVTSSPLLAIRDQEEWKSLYALFGVTSCPVPPQHQDKSSFENQDKLLEKAYEKQVVYGTVSTFAADILRQEFEKKTTRGHRKFECVIVDEVDYMTLDSGVQVTFLSHQASSLRHVEQVLTNIWAMMSGCRPIEMFETGEIQWATRIQHFHKTMKQAAMGPESEDFPENDILMLGAKLGFYPQEDMDALNKAMTQTQTENDSSEDDRWKATENIMAQIGPKEQYELLSELQRTADHSVAVDCYSLVNNKANLYRKGSSHRGPDVSMLLLQSGRACEIMSEESLIEGTVDKLKSRIKYSSECSLQSMKESEGFIVIPSFLKEYLGHQLTVFAENALKAIRMTPGREYMIDKDAEADRAGFLGAENHQYDAIIPVDFQASGVLEKNKRWGDGLQQFLEMKHQLAVSQLSNVTNYMSNVHFFKRYLSGKGIFGVSGTLGGEAEKVFLERQYKTACYAIPAHRHKKLVELPAVQVRGGNAEWIQVIGETAWRAADRGQVVLIICEDVKTADELKTQMQGQERSPDQITMYTISAKHNIEKQTFGRGNIIIATNLGGRGTDIHVQQEVNERGGLFVLLTYFPGSQRVERQVFGRTARKGNPGMVQMVLNQHHLVPAYQGHSVETMRQLREEYEVSRLDGMERNELFEIESKEDLFSRFCQFLCDFDKNYTQKERSDITSMRLKDVPQCFKVHRDKFDYQTALNALKESWALWLILHEERIGERDIPTLREDLMKDLQKTAELLLKGRSSNFYDYIELAKSRTAMHQITKKKSDYGALRYWQSAAECDPFYSAVALYNQAYITVNLGKKNYITEAKRLLEEATTAVDVYLSETTNTTMFCNFSVTKDFAPHHKDSNLQSQMKARMSVFKAWKGYIESALKTLEQIEKSKGEAITEDSSVYSLSRDQDPITTKELMVLHEFGLCMVFQVKKKPEFSLDALICCCLGALQVAAGVLVCTLSCGSASQFGLGLISEGVSDMIHGIKGMIQGSFDWAEWAISKAISIVVSLVFGGFSRLKKAVSAVGKGTKGLITGAKTYSAITVKQCFKHAAKYTVQELGKQGCVTALNYAIDKGMEAFFKTVLSSAFKDKVLSLIRANVRLDTVLTDFICSGIPKTAIKQEFNDFRIDRRCEEEMRQSVDMMTTSIIPDLMMDCTMVMKVLDRLSEVCGAITGHVEKQKGLQLAMKCLKSAQYITLCTQIQRSFPSEDVINNTFIPQLLETMNELPHEKYDQDGRHQLSDVERLKKELINIIAESVSNSFVEACSRHMSSFMNRACMTKISNAAGSAVSNLLGRTDAQSFFDNQVYKHHVNKAIRGPCESLSEADKKDLDCYIEGICDVNRPATALDIHVLTQSDSLQGKGIRLMVVDKHGRKLSEDYFPGKDSSAGDIVLQLKKDPETPQQTEGILSKLWKRARGEQSPYSGHFEILRRDGSVVPVYSEGQNCLYHAVAQATNRSADPKQQAVILRNQVKHSLQQDTSRYAAVLKLQRGYEETNRSPVKYTIAGGGRKTQHEAKEMFKDRLNTTKMEDLPEKDLSIIKTYNLGLIGKFDDIKGVRRANGSTNINPDNNSSSPVNADHIPPINTFQKAHEMLNRPENRELKEKLIKDHAGLYSMVDGRGNRGLCREVLTHHHRLALTTGNSTESQAVRTKLAQVLLSGDEVKLMKMSMIVANPEMSESLRRDAGITRGNNRPDILSREATRQYHGIGDHLLVNEYHKMGVINEKAAESLHQWQKGQLYSRNSAEYHELLDVLRHK